MKRQVLLILFLSFGLHAKSPPSDWDYYLKGAKRSDRCDPMMQAGFTAFDSGNFWTAKNLFERALGRGCRDGLGYFKLGQLFEAMGGKKPALLWYEKAKPLMEERYPTHPETAGIGERIARSYFQLKEYDKALPLYLEVIQKRGENFERLYIVGQMYRILGQPVPAIDYLEKGLRCPTLGADAPATGASVGHLKTGVRLELLNLYTAQKDFEKAKGMMKEILDEDPSNPAALAFQEQLRRQEAKEKEHQQWNNILNN